MMPLALETRQFHVLRSEMSCPPTLPWTIVEPWRNRAQLNHNQTLEQLDERGGLSPYELWCAAHDLPIFPMRAIDKRIAGEWIKSLVATQDTDEALP